MAARARIAFAAALFLAPLTLAPSARADDVGLARSGLAWLAGQPQLAPAPYAVEAAAALGVDAARWPSATRSALSAAVGYASQYGALYGPERAAHAIGSDGYDPRTTGAQDLVLSIRAGFDGVQFGSATFINDDMWAILGLRAAGVSSTDGQIQAAADFILTHRGADGGWAYTTVATASSVDTTGYALAALAAAGRLSGGDVAAQRFLDSLARADGGHASTAGQAASNCQSTVWAIHAESILGGSEASDLSFLRTLVNTDGGFSPSFDTHGRLGPSDFQCTAEAVVALAGARYPLPGLAPATWSVPTRVTRGEPVALALNGSFARIAWSTPWGTLADGHPMVNATKAGSFEIAVDASGPDGVFRRHATIRIDPLAPRLSLDVANATLHRGELFSLTPTLWADDGRTAHTLVDWGDGNASRTLARAFSTPGNRTILAWPVDDLGTRGATLAIQLSVVNRAPEWGTLPARIDADRHWAPPASWNVSDADGDPIDVQSLVVGGLTLGPHDLQLVARDAYGGEAAANTTLLVSNDPPVLGPLRMPTSAQADSPFAYSTQATDADGPAPRVTWWFGERAVSGASGRIALSTGNYSVRVEAFDADGAATETHATLVVLPGSTHAAAQPTRAIPTAMPGAAPPTNASSATAIDESPPPSVAPPAPSQNLTIAALAPTGAPTAPPPTPSTPTAKTPLPLGLALLALLLAARRRRVS